MRSICFVAGVLLISAAIAAEQPRSTAEELVAEVSGLLARGVSDKKIAGSIEKVHLSDCLTDKLIADLTKQYRIGPYTTFALDIQANESQALMPSADTIPSDLAPSADQIDLMTDRLRKYVDQSLASWKKFVAKSSITRLANYKGEFRVQSGKIWYPHERFQFELPESVNTPNWPSPVFARRHVPLASLGFLRRAQSCSVRLR